MYFRASTLDDLMRCVILAVLKRGARIEPRKGPALELAGVILELSNPRARLSRTETRGRAFSCLGELCWYLSESRALDFIEYYIPRYRSWAEGAILHGAYGPRLFAWNGQDQVANIIDLLRRQRDTRQAVIQIFDAGDIAERHLDVPCTCTLQFLKRGQVLHMFASMRSNDAHLGLPHDIFAFTMLQELIARSLSVEVGLYKHAVGSLHLYERDVGACEQFLEEGWQATTLPMPDMPAADPWPAIEQLLEAEAIIRTQRQLPPDRLQRLDPYWADLVRLLQVFGCKKTGDWERVPRLRSEMQSGVYATFIDRLMDSSRPDG